ncbi:MAG: sensor domain-containing diguanylate cyclase [Spirochaetales bacterium]|nr:sensor domain-containing diguanylate cyclase [Spirochaetales bacterium]
MLISEYEKQIFDLKQLLEISKSLSSTLDYNILMGSILYTCMGQMKVLKAGLFTKRSIEHSYLSLHRNYKGFELDKSLDYSIPGDSELIEIFRINPKCYTLPELLAKVKNVASIKLFTFLEPSLVVPLKSKNEVNGIIVIGERIDGTTFSEPEKEYLENIATFAAIAVQNVYLFEITSTDMMTKLKLKHFFISKLEKMIEEQRTPEGTENPLSVIMCDIDFFKKLNDTYGHTCGDIILKKVASLIQKNIRQFDTAARYGGEEFVISLPGGDLEKARQVGERIRLAVESIAVEYEGSTVTTTISLGAAQFDPAEDSTAEMLIKRADDALYRSKHDGRNRISTAP